MSCQPGLCHGSHCVSCASCGLVAPCCRPDCRSCKTDLRTAKERHLNKARWLAEGTIRQCMFADIPLR